MIALSCVRISIVAFVLQVAAGGEAGVSQNAASLRTPHAVLTVIDEAGAVHPVSAEDFSRLPRQSANVTTHGVKAEFAGVLLVDLLKSCGVAFGDELRGRRAPTVAILEATDDYRVVVSLLEIDPNTNDKVAMVADRRDGNPLSDREGPLRLVLPGEKREVRWIRNLRIIRVLNLKEYPLEQTIPNGAPPQHK